MSLIEQRRRQAQAVFENIGLPDRRDEDWKYTDAERLAGLLEAGSENVSVDVKGLGIKDLDAYRLVFINGVFADKDSNKPQGVEVSTVASLLADQDKDSEQVARLFEVSGDEPLSNGFYALNAAQATDGLAICIKDGIKLDKPLYVLHVSNQNNIVRHGVMLGKYAEVEWIEHFVGLDGSKALSNISSNVILNDGAVLNHYRLQQEGEKHNHYSRVEVKQHRDSSYVFHGMELGASLSRSDVVVNLAEQGATCELNGLFVLNGRQHVDHHTRVDHAAPHCTSVENYRTVLDGRSHGVFNGKIMVHEGAIKTDSSMSNANLLLSKKAEVDTKPELEIYNDDVKCAHGATVGQLDQAQLFYMRSRGLSEAEAKEVLTFAFADEVLTAMDNNTVRRFVEREAFSKLPHSGDLDGLLG
ncbi:MAG: Fe-S cluster assembly protein SufD [Mariprofundaceae bacterium]